MAETGTNYVGIYWITYACRSCKVSYSPTTGHIALCNPIQHGLMVEWDITNHTCHYGDQRPVIMREAQKLPWLSYDISIERLKTLLLVL